MPGLVELAGLKVAILQKTVSERAERAKDVEQEEERKGGGKEKVEQGEDQDERRREDCKKRWCSWCKWGRLKGCRSKYRGRKEEFLPIDGETGGNKAGAGAEARAGGQVFAALCCTSCSTESKWSELEMLVGRFFLMLLAVASHRRRRMK